MQPSISHVASAPASGPRRGLPVSALVLATSCLVAGAVALAQVPAPGAAATAPSAPEQNASPPSATDNELDAFMARVLARRDDTWLHLRDYVLDESERLEILGPGGLPLHRLRRDFTWYSRDGFLVRSPVRADGVTVSEQERRDYEARWLRAEQQRAQRHAEKDAARAAGAGAEPTAATYDDEISIPAGIDDDRSHATPSTPAEALDAEAIVRHGGQPRFISEAYFLKFKFEPGNYYFAGRETLDSREVLRIEYYPTRLFQSDGDRDAGSGQAAHEQHLHHAEKDEARERDMEARMERGFNKVALITLWVDPATLQIVKYTFDNVDFGFLPFRSVVRLDTVRASMEMGQFLDGAWLPRRIDMTGGLTLANGGFTFRYGRQFSDYRQAETSATIRHIEPPREP